MRPRRLPLALLGLLAPGCGVVAPTPVTLPPGEIPVHVTVEDNPQRVVLMPDSVRAGTRYLLFDGPATGFTLVGGADSSEEAPTPLGPGEVEQVADGNFEDVTFIRLDVTCDAERWTEDRHWLGCGELFQLRLAPGLYPILPADPEPGERSAFFVLEVTP